MSDDAEKVVPIRAAILGADRPIRAPRGSDRGPRMPPPPEDGDACPINALGHLAGVFHFLDTSGQARELSARQLGARHDLVALFGGNDAWLRHNFPKRVPIKGADNDGEETERWRTVDFRLNDAAAWLQRACFIAGLFGEHVMIRQPGIWRDPYGMPVVHCGDEVLIGDSWEPAGARTGNQIWGAAPPTPRPGLACDSAPGRELLAGLRNLWNWREPGAPIAVMGLLGNAYYGAAPEWRPSSFITGETGGGKSMLLTVLRHALPLHYYDNDTTKAGIEQAVHGRAMPIVIDEAADRANRGAARDLADLVLSASGGEGTRGSRGTSDGKGRRIELAGLILMFSINPPELEAQHLGRLTLIDLEKPAPGQDNRHEHAALAKFAREHARAWWGRALQSWDRYVASLERFRAGLGAAGCAPREMDQAGALLAGYWIMTQEGLPEAADIRRELLALHGAENFRAPGLIRLARDIEDDSRPISMIRHLASSMITVHRSTEREALGKLAEIAFGDPQPDLIRSPIDARDHLLRHGIRIIMACLRPGEAASRAGKCRCPHCLDPKGKDIPRSGEGQGAWFSRTNPELRKLFNGTPYEGDRWTYEMRRLPGARASAGGVRIGSSAPGRALWLPRATFLGDDLRDDDAE